MHVFVLGGVRRSSLVRTTWKWLIGRHTTDPGTHYFAARRLRVKAVRRPVPADVDGEINEQTPLDLEVLPAALRVVVPHDFQAESV